SSGHSGSGKSATTSHGHNAAAARQQGKTSSSGKSSQSNTATGHPKNTSGPQHPVTGSGKPDHHSPNPHAKHLHDRHHELARLRHEVEKMKHLVHKDHAILERERKLRHELLELERKLHHERVGTARHIPSQGATTPAPSTNGTATATPYKVHHEANSHPGKHGR